MFGRLNLVAINDIFAAHINYDLSSIVIACLLVLDDNLMLARFDVTSETVNIF